MTPIFDALVAEFGDPLPPRKPRARATPKVTKTTRAKKATK